MGPPSSGGEKREEEGESGAPGETPPPSAASPFRKPFARRLLMGALAIYTPLLFTVLLWPLDFEFSRKNNVRWQEGGDGAIVFSGKGKVLSPGPADRLTRRLASGSGLSLIIRAATGQKDQEGPARIVSLSSGITQRNFTLGQSGDRLVIRLRTTRTDPNGATPHLSVAGVFGDDRPKHIAVTYDFARQRVFVDGRLRAQAKIPGGRLDNWDPACRLILGNEVTENRPWLGRLYKLEIYDRALSEAAVESAYRSEASPPSARTADPPAGALPAGVSGTRPTALSPASVPRTSEPSGASPPAARYLFERGSGRRVQDSGDTAPPLDLVIPEALSRQAEPYLRLPLSALKDPVLLTDAILNVILFIPFGFLFSAAIARRQAPSIRQALFVLMAGALFITAIETLQYFSPSRFSSVMDLFNNILGTALGIAALTALLRHGERPR